MVHHTQTWILALVSTLVTGALIGCASSRNQTKVQTTKETTQTHTASQAAPPAPTADTAATEPNMAAPSTHEEDSLVSSIEFARGQRTLNPEATAELNRVLSEAREKGEVAGVDIIVWPDSAATAKMGKAQSRSAIETARQRGENIEKYVDRMEPAANVQVHNMATRPDAFMNYLNAQDEMTKEKLAQAGLAADPETDEVKGRTSSAVILIKMK